MPFWISVAIRQGREVAVLGCHVSQLVLLHWPPAFSPPMLAQIHMGSEWARKAFWSRVHWPWESPAPLHEDEVELTGSLSRTTSSVWTARSESVKIVTLEAARAWSQVAWSCPANTQSRLGEP